MWKFIQKLPFVNKKEHIKRSQYESVDSWIASGLPLGNETISEKEALSIPALYKGIDMLSSLVASLEINVLRRVDDGKEKFTDHPAQKIIRYQANNSQSSLRLKKAVTKDSYIYGNGYIRINYASDGVTPASWTRLNPTTTEPIVVNGELAYETMIDGRKLRYPAYQIIHLMSGLGDGIKGYGIIDLFSQILKADIAKIQHEMSFFDGGAAESIWFKPPMGTTKEAVDEFVEKIRKAKIKKYGEKGVLEAGWDIVSTSYSLKDSLLTELNESHLEYVANILNIPRSFLNSSLNSSSLTWEADKKRLLGQTLTPHLADWESQLWSKMLTEAEKESGNILIEFDRRGLEAGDEVAKAQSVISQSDHGLITKNEARKALGYAPIKEDWADQFSIPENMTFVNQKLDSKRELESSQIQNIVSICKDVVGQGLPIETAFAVIQLAFPHVEEAQIRAILKPLESFEKAAEPEPAKVAEEVPESTLEQAPEADAVSIARSLSIATCERLEKRIQKAIEQKGNHDLQRFHLPVLTEACRPINERSAEICSDFLEALQEELNHALPEQVVVTGLFNKLVGE